jgi:hypothetical protein
MRDASSSNKQQFKVNPEASPDEKIKNEKLSNYLKKENFQIA